MPPSSPCGAQADRLAQVRMRRDTCGERRRYNRRRDSSVLRDLVKQATTEALLHWPGSTCVV